LKRVLATLFIALGLGGLATFAAPAAGANPLIDKIVVIIDPAGPPPCIYANVTLFGNRFGTGYPGICFA